MIRLHKGDVPNVLRDNSARWTAIVIEKLAQSVELAKAEKSRYNHPDIKAAILAETHGKCAYCESKVRHIAYGDIEHVVPKAVDPNLWFQWSNLTLACDICNTNKAEALNLIDPYAEDPETKLVFLGASVWPAPGEERSDLTIRELELNREELVGRRQERIEYLLRFAAVISRTESADIRRLLEADFKLELESDKEYAALSRAISRELVHNGTISA